MVYAKKEAIFKVQISSEDSQILFSWGRYLYWADLRQRDWDKFMTEMDDKERKKVIPGFLGVSCYWGASVYVVIEGWEAAKFDDPLIEALLRLSNYKDVLRRLRNFAFHYQPELLSPKFIDFFRSPESLLWLHFLHEEFCRWMRDWVEAVETSGLFSQEQSQEWRDNFETLVGWLPLRLGEEGLQDFKRYILEIEQKIEGNTSESAEDLRASLRICSYDSTVKRTEEAVRNYRRDRLADLGLNPDDFIHQTDSSNNRA